ncbi:hypothetical protein [Spirillospora sp. CA-294931]|uniref:hypothetical protein n=1 Tax=Spirillospora sp. CA-294931 TaxID=3240042 RepID=UPI003D9076FD
MPLFEMTPESLVPVPSSTFTAEQVLERADLQRLLRARISAIADGVLIISEEFGAFADARRRIDLLGIDREGHLVVFELKRTEDGGHLELQALRYAAMVSAMTFEDLVEHYERYLARVEPSATEEARARLVDWLEEADAENTVLSREVRIVLVSGGFDREITTTVLWLTEVYGLDIRCVRLTPYKVGDRLLLDVQQVIPLPEASELTIQLRRRETQARAARTGDGPDWTPYVITTPDGHTEPLRKRRAVLAMVVALQSAGVTAEQLAEALPNAKFISVEGILTEENLAEALVAAYPNFSKRLQRWFLETPIHDAGRTWVLSKMWGANTERILERLTALAPPGSRFGYEPAPTR